MPTRLVSAVEQATPISNEINPNPLNQRNSNLLPEHVLKIGQHHVAANQQSREIKDRHQKKSNPGPILNQVAKIA